MSDRRTRVGDLRPSQLLFTYGVGALVDLPHLSVIVLGLDDWPSSSDNYRDLIEPRLLLAVQSQLGPQVTQLRTPPLPPDRSGSFVPLDNQELVGVPVVPFPRWMVCPRCQLLAPISSGLFSLRRDGVRADRNRYVHEMCEKGRSPAVVPARFLVACEKGHLDDFPWSQYVHEGSTSCSGRLRLREYGPSGEARELEVSCDECGKRKRLSQAFGEAGRARLPLCRSRRPHLRDFDSTECGERVRAILLGASNLWFGDILSTVALPTGAQGLDHLIEEYWANLQVITSLEVVVAFRRAGMLGALSRYSDIEIWEAVDRKRQRDQAGLSLETTDLKRPEWNMFTRPGEAPNSGDFRLREVAVPLGFERFLERVVLVERLREVRAFIGFTRIEAPSEFGEDAEDMSARRMVVARHAPSWVPAAEVRGEGLFIQFKEAAVRRWLDRRPVNHRDTEFERAHQNWRKLRGIAPPEAGYPGMRYVLLHSFAHSIMRQLSLESGYTMASVRERIYSRDPEPTHSDGEPMAGVLIYTSAPDSEGTLGGLVSLGEPDEFRRLLTGALREAQLCASDPLCAEHEPTQDQGISLHGAACHTCMLAPETACERGNKYLDRSALVATVYKANLAFFTDDDGLV